LKELKDAGIPMRQRTASGIMHYKLMMFAGQGIVEFSGANFSADAWGFTGTSPYVNYVDESAYFTDNPSFVHSFMSKYDDLWTNTTAYKDYANVPATLLRNYGPVGTYVKDPQLNFPPAESYANRAIGRYNKENQKIDVIMYRITDRRHTDAIIAAKTRGVPVRLISEPQQYRDVTRLWDAWNVDRLYAAGIPIKMRAHQGLNHEKLVLLYGQTMSIFDASVRYAKENVPLVILAGKEYGSGSSRDWAAKGPKLLGVRAVIAESFERIHRSNLVGMGVLPLQADVSGLSGEEEITVVGVAEALNAGELPRTCTVRAGHTELDARVRIDTPKEAEYFRHGGILPYDLRQLLEA